VIWKVLEIGALLFTLLNVWLAVKENIWTWPTGITCVLLTFFVLWHERYYFNAWLQWLYVALSIHGWYEWLHGGENHRERHVAYASLRVWIGTLSAGVILTFVFLKLLQRYAPGSTVPFWDASTTAFSVAGQWLMNMKYIENWIFWIAVDLAYVVMYAHGNLPYLAVLNAILVILCVKGYLDWRKSALAVSA
jgi:nicotinamide mononucleotide transporter